ncbi:MAG: HAMP domain-containing protein, partial [Streptomyces sp.]|uniref:HAMP domain-containing protein n=1 Tax=Streptomyces sp. TaxID=1931 RepID=UPI003D6AB0C2
MDDPNGQSVRAADLRPLLGALRSLCDGDFSVRVASEDEGVLGELTGVFNRIAARNEHLSDELARVRREVVRHGRLDERVTASPGQGAWTSSVNDANNLVESLATPVTKASRVLEAVAGGDLTQHMELHDGNRQLHGDLRQLATGLNVMVDQLSMFTGEVTRVAREVGTEGRLGGRAEVGELAGDWR